MGRQYVNVDVAVHLEALGEDDIPLTVLTTPNTITVAGNFGTSVGFCATSHLLFMVIVYLILAKVFLSEKTRACLQPGDASACSATSGSVSAVSPAF